MPRSYCRRYTAATVLGSSPEPRVEITTCNRPSASSDHVSRSSVHSPVPGLGPAWLPRSNTRAFALHVTEKCWRSASVVPGSPPRPPTRPPTTPPRMPMRCSSTRWPPPTSRSIEMWLNHGGMGSPRTVVVVTDWRTESAVGVSAVAGDSRIQFPLKSTPACACRNVPATRLKARAAIGVRMYTWTRSAVFRSMHRPVGRLLTNPLTGRRCLLLQLILEARRPRQRPSARSRPRRR
jgi:hypothetical protein